MEQAAQNRLNAVAKIAVSLEQETGLPAKVLIAQWAIESRWGAKPAGNANYFGIKKADRHTQCCTVTTREVIGGKDVIGKLDFADYASLEDSCRDYAWLITHGSPYRSAWEKYQANKDVRSFVSAVARTYATDPHYAEMAVQIAIQGNVAAAIAQALVDRELKGVS